MRALRSAVAIHLALVVAQAVFAGQFLAGADASVVLHERVGQIAAAVALIQIAISALRRIPARTFVPFLVTSILVFLAEGLQIGTGYGRFLAVHVPLGVLICGAVAAQLVWTFRWPVAADGQRSSKPR